MIKKVYNIEADVNVTGLDEFDKSVEQSASDVDKLIDALGDLTDEQKKANQAAEKRAKDLEDANKSATKSVGGLSTGFKAVGTAIKGAGIGILISLFVGLKEVLGQNQEVLDFFSTAMTTFTIVVNEVVDVFKEVFKSTSEANGGFDALGKVLSGLITLAITPFKLAFDGIRLVIANAQLAWEESVFGGQDADKILELQANVEAVKDSLKETATEAAQAGFDIVTNVGEAIGEVTDFVVESYDALKEISVTAAIAEAERIQATKNAAQIAAALNQGLIEDNDRLAEQQRQIRDNVNLSLEERIAANNKLNEIFEIQKAALLANADITIQAARDQVKLNDNVENQVALIEALNEKKAIEAQITGFQSEQIVNKIALENEELALNQTATEAGNARRIQEAEWNAERISDTELRVQAQKEALELEKQLETERLEFLISTLAEGTQARVDAEQELFDFQQDLKQREIELDDELLAIKEEQANKKLEIQETLTQSGADAIDAIAGFVDEETALGKSLIVAKQAALAAQLVIDIQSQLSSANKTVTEATLAGAESGADVAKGAAKTVGSAPFPANIPLIIGYAVTAAGIIASVVSAVRKAKQAGQSVGASGGGSTPSISVPSAPAGAASAPNFNVVGDTGTNQIVDAIGSQNQTPVKAYVVSTDMSNQQALDRQIESNAVL